MLHKVDVRSVYTQCSLLVACVLLFSIAALYAQVAEIVESQTFFWKDFLFIQNDQEKKYYNHRILQVINANESDDSTCFFSRNLTWKPFELAVKTRIPPLLLSYPGSGNSWMRVVLEQATGIVSGALEVNDTQYQGQFLGEKFCGIRQSVIKAHPQDFLPYIKDKPIRFLYKIQKRKCKRGMIDKFPYIIFVIRNPADAIWSQYQLLTSHSHVGRIPKSQFNESSWNEFVAQTALEWNEQWTNFVYPLINSTPAENVHILKYEEIIKVEKGVSEVHSILKNLMNMSVSRKRVECSLLQSRMGIIKRPDNFEDNYVTSGLAFHQSLLPKTICLARRELGAYMKFGNYSLELQPSIKVKEDYGFISNSSLKVTCAYGDVS